MTGIVRIWRLAPLIAGLFLGGCVNDVTIPPEGTNLLWNTVGFPGRQRARCIATDPDGRIILGVYDYERESALNVGAVYISLDKGETWMKKQLGPFEIMDLAIDSEGRIFAAGYWRIMRSQDHGETWEELSFHLHSPSWLTLVIDSADNLYAQTHYSGIYFSEDHGDNWTQIGDSIRAAGEITSLAVNSKGCLFAFAGGHLYKSCDRGASWTEPQDVPWEWLFGENVAIDSRDRIFVQNSSKLHRSTDDGETWTTLEPQELSSARDISIDGRDRLYALCSSRLYVSDNSGDSWALVLSLWTSLRDVASNAAGDIFAIGYWGVSRSVDGGASWEMLGFSEYRPADIAVDGNGFYYVGLACGGVYRSIGSLGRWERFNAGLPDVELNCLAIANDSTLMAGTSNGVYVSPDDRPAWSPAWLAGINARKVFAFPGDSLAVFSNSILISTDNGSTWSDIGQGGYEIKDLIRTADGSLLAGANFGGVFRYTGEGMLWDQMNDGLDDLGVNALAITRSGDILAGTDAGIFISSNGAVSWRRFSKEQLRIATILVMDEDIFFGTVKGILWARTDGSAPSMQNDGIPIAGDSIPIAYESAIISIAADPDDYLFLFFGWKFYRSSQSTKDLLK